jgi:membrane fusion protein (multidrug efflux system)
VKSRKKQVIIGVAISALFIASRMVWLHFNYVSTDDAQIGAHVAILSSRVNGTIQKVFVQDNQKVKAGEPLAQIDTSDYSSASDAAEAQVASLQARYKEAETTLRRATELFQKQAIARDRFDAAQADYKEIGGRLKAAQAALEQAKLNVSYTRILAPEDGRIARKSVEPGQYVPAGQALFGFVSSSERWVVANLKETDLSGVAPGKRAEVEVDAVPGRTFQGAVESISPSTGAVFSLLPPDNATGNFTKVVQRVPVRIKLVELNPEDVDLLHAGLSANVSIHLR